MVTAAQIGSTELTETQRRQGNLILSSFGEEILRYWKDEAVSEIYLNDDYLLRLDTIYGRKRTDIKLNEEIVQRICMAIAGYNHELVDNNHPRLGIELDTLRIRAQIQYPPVVSRPVFFLRKMAARIYTLEEYLAQGILEEKHYNYIIQAIQQRKNVIVVGATNSGKTTFLNAVLKKLSEVHPDHRLLILQDASELQCSSDDVQYLKTAKSKEHPVTMEDLVFDSLRLSPDRIIVGEVRDGSAYDVLKAWNTGHPGGFCTIHADGCADAFTRLELLVKESGISTSTEDIRYLIGGIVKTIISIQKKTGEDGTHRKVDEIIEVSSYNEKQKKYVFDVI